MGLYEDTTRGKRINHMPYIIQFENEEPIYTEDE